MKKIQRNHTTLLVALLLLPFFIFINQTNAQNDDAVKRFYNNVVQLTATFSNKETEDGFGFVVGEQNNKLYVVTAEHVVVSDNAEATEKVEAQFYTNKGKSFDAILLDIGFGLLDLALLEVAKPSEDYMWESRYIDSKLEKGEEVWFIGREKDWDVPEIPGRIHGPPTQGEFSVDMSSVIKGTSGAPLISKEGIVGMIFQDGTAKVTAISIETIQNVVKNQNKPWGLMTKEAEMEKLNVSKEEALKVARTRIGPSVEAVIPFRNEGDPNQYIAVKHSNLKAGKGGNSSHYIFEYEPDHELEDEFNLEFDTSTITLIKYQGNLFSDTKNLRLFTGISEKDNPNYPGFGVDDINGDGSKEIYVLSEYFWTTGYRVTIWIKNLTDDKISRGEIEVSTWEPDQIGVRTDPSSKLKNFDHWLTEFANSFADPPSLFEKAMAEWYSNHGVGFINGKIVVKEFPSENVVGNEEVIGNSATCIIRGENGEWISYFKSGVIYHDKLKKTFFVVFDFPGCWVSQMYSSSKFLLMFGYCLKWSWITFEKDTKMLYPGLPKNDSRFSSLNADNILPEDLKKYSDLETCADVNAKDIEGPTAIIWAARHGQADTVKALIEAGADVNAKNNEGSTASIEVAGWGHIDTVKALIEAGADVNAEDFEGSTALIEAASGGHTDTVKALIEAGADVNAKDNYDYTALMRVAYDGRPDIVKALIEAGANVNAKNNYDYTALIEAAWEGHTDTVKALIEAGADVNAEDFEGFTALMRAASGGHTDTVDLLKSAGSKDNP